MKTNELIREAEYMDIILTLLSEPYVVSSVTKIIFLSFCICHEENFVSYAKRKRDFVDVFFQNISMKLSNDYRDINSILCVLNLLQKTARIIIVDDEIQIKENIKHKPENEFMQKCAVKIPDPILEINKLDSVAIIEEVLRYV